MNHPLIVLILFAVTSINYSPPSWAQSPPRHHGGKDAGGGMKQNIQQRANRNMTSSDATAVALRNLPDPTTLSQMMLATYDADASGELNQAELQSALEGLRQMIAQSTQTARTAQQNQVSNRNGIGPRIDGGNKSGMGSDPQAGRGGRSRPPLKGQP